MRRFWDKVTRTDGCWLWGSHRDKRGYGRFFLDGKARFAHRVSLTLAGTTVPDDLMVLHRCDNPPCVNPSHLYVGDASQNQLDAHARKRRRSDGDWNGNRILTSEKVARIRALYAAGVHDTGELANAFGVNRWNVRQVVSGRIWKGVAG